MKTRILICGATGFIGRNLVNYLSVNPDYLITAVCYKRNPYECAKNVTWVKGSLLDAGFVKDIVSGHDIIIQAAAVTSGAGDIVNSPHIHITDNAIMNSLLLRAAYEHQAKHFVFFSCTIMYPSSDMPVREADFDGEIVPKYFGAGWTKVYIEKMCEFFSMQGRTKFSVIRHSNIYGPWDKFDLKRSHVFGATMSKIMTAEKEIVIWGNGEERRDLLHVDDLVKCVEKLLNLQKVAYALYNCGAGVTVSVSELVDMMIMASGKSVQKVFDTSKPSIPFNLELNCSEAQKTLGWIPDISLETGIAQTMDWWKKNINPKTLSLY